MNAKPTPENANPEVTRHGGRRMRQRLGIPKAATEKNARIALERGICHGETTGALSGYLTALYFEHHNANNIRIWCNFIYIFCCERLITVFPLPQKYRRTVEKLKRRKTA